MLKLEIKLLKSDPFLYKTTSEITPKDCVSFEFGLYCVIFMRKASLLMEILKTLTGGIKDHEEQALGKDTWVDDNIAESSSDDTNPSSSDFEIGNNPLYSLLGDGSVHKKGRMC